MIDWEKLKMNYNAIGRRSEISPEAIGLAPLIKSIIEKNEEGCVSHFYAEGYSDKAFEVLSKKIEDLKGRKIYERIIRSMRDHLYIWNDAFVQISTSSKMMTINAISTNDAITAACKEVATMFTATAKKGYVFAITRGSSGLQLTRIGYAGSSLEKNNYTDDVCRDYDYVVEDLQSPDPSGRIIILDGPPGCGKTFMIRGILMDAAKAMFVIVPPNMIASIGGPELIPLLLRTKEDYGKKGPIVLILEDADQCLAPRESDNISAISSILNLGDGIFGSLFDVRIIATTNAKAKDLDRAITRDMRLSKRMSLLPFNYNNADKIYKRIFNDKTKELPKPAPVERDMMKPANEKNSFTLAEIYKLARDNGWRPAKSNTEEPTNLVRPSFEEDYPEDMDYDNEV